MEIITAVEVLYLMETHDAINKNLNKPLYKQVKDYILDRIERGIYQPDQPITSERDLCQELDVSRYTIRNAIQELVQTGDLYRVQGYGTLVSSKPSAARGGDRAKHIGVILDFCQKELESRMLAGIESVLSDNSYSMTYMSSNNDYKKEAENIQKLKNEGVEGLIILPAEDQEGSKAIFDLKSQQFPFVLVDRRLKNCQTDCVMSDNIKGAYLATEHLIKSGHEKIAFVKNRYSKTISIEERITGYRKALEEYQISFNEELLFAYDQNRSQDKKGSQLHNFITRAKPTAIIALHDYAALDIYKVCRSCDINIPAEISVIGFDNLELTKHLEVPLTTVAQFPREIGREAARLLLKRIKAGRENRPYMLTQLYYPVELVIRDSCREII